ncbi:hypothetical protein Sa4125_00800 [Aureimonas sp. SA4125]|nr:hypothetical protein Sa4125_00800 [Aureimonas sp. SA4125]
MSDAALARAVEAALRRLRIVAVGSDEARLRSAVDELGSKKTPRLAAPKLADNPYAETQIQPFCAESARADRRDPA